MLSNVFKVQTALAVDVHSPDGCADGRMTLPVGVALALDTFDPADRAANIMFATAVFEIGAVVNGEFIGTNIFVEPQVAVAELLGYQEPGEHTGEIVSVPGLLAPVG